MALTKKEFFVQDLIIDDEYGVIDSKATIQEAAKKMKELGVPDLVVVEGDQQEVLGVIADFDIVQNVVAEGIDANSEKVTIAMYKITPVELNTPVQEAFTRMRNLNANVVPVVENGKLLGVCTIQDCWSYIPDKVVDEIGLIPVKNTRVAEFWFASVCAILAFTLGIILPLAGVFGFFTGKYSDLTSLLGSVPLGDPTVFFTLFDVRGADVMITFLELFTRNGPIWIAISIFSVLLVVFGLIGLFSIIYTSFSDTRNLETRWIIRMIVPGLVVVFMVIEWILFGIAFSIATPQPIVAIDAIGLTMSIISMLLFLLAINRDYLFRGIESPESKESEVTV